MCIVKWGSVLVHSTSLPNGDKASYHSAVSLETVGVEWMGLEGAVTAKSARPSSDNGRGATTGG